MSCPAHALANSRGLLVEEDVDLIREIVRGLPADAEIVDLGAGSGTTALACFSERADIWITTVDNNGERLDWARFQLESDQLGAGHWRAELCDSALYAKQHDGEVDFLMVDTSHEGLHTLAELALWIPRLRPGTPIWMHDYVGEYPGVPWAVDVFRSAQILRFVAQDGLGVHLVRE